MPDYEQHIIAYIQDPTDPDKPSQKLFELENTNDVKTQSVFQLRDFLAKHIPKEYPDTHKINLITVNTDPKSETLKSDGKVYNKNSDYILYDPGTVYDTDEIILSAPLSTIRDNTNTYYLLQTKHGETEVLETSPDYQAIQKQGQFVQTYVADPDSKIHTTSLPSKFADLDNEGNIVPKNSSIQWSENLTTSENPAPKERKHMPSKIRQTGKNIIKKVPGFAVKVETKNHDQFYFKFLPHDSKAETINCFQISSKGVTLKKEARHGTDFKKTGNQFIQDTVGKDYTAKEIPLIDIEQLQKAKDSLAHVRNSLKHNSQNKDINKPKH